MPAALMIHRLVSRDGADCYWCGIRTRQHPRPYSTRWPDDARTRDHLVPRSAGGANDLANQVVACHACNSTRGSIPADVWAWAMTRARACPVPGELPSITARALAAVCPIGVPPAPTAAARRRERRRQQQVRRVQYPPPPGQRMECPACEVTWNVRDQNGGCGCSTGPRAPWPPPDPDWVPGTF